MGCSGSKDAAAPPVKEAATGGTATGTPPAVPQESEPETKPVAAVEDVAEEAPSLTAEQLTQVDELFKEWDIDGEGRLPITNFDKKSETVIGNQKFNIVAKLGEMDYDGDGFVTLEEWKIYFTAAAALSRDEYDFIINAMKDAAGVVVTIIKAGRLAAEVPVAPPAEDLEVTPLAADRVDVVEKLFAAWDLQGTGSIDRRQLTHSSTVEIGPIQANVFSQLEAMDTDGDQLVTKQEMMVFFQGAAALSDEEFSTITGAMLTVAQDQGTIAMLTQMAAEVSGPPEEDVEKPPALAGERLEKLQTLWELLSPNLETPVKLEDLQKAEQGSKIGPHSVSVLKELYGMDANSDGALEWGELLAYFTATGAILSDDEYEMVVGDMITRIQMQLLAASLG